MKILTTESKSIATLTSALNNGYSHLSIKGELLSIRVLIEAYSLKYGMSEETIRTCLGKGWGVYWKQDNYILTLCNKGELLEICTNNDYCIGFQYDYSNYYIKLED